MPGDKTAETNIKPAEGHYDEETKPEQFNIKQVFVSPSMQYSGLNTYSPKKIYEDSSAPGKNLSARVGFQVRIQPGKYSVGPETVGATTENYVIDRHFKNSENWNGPLNAGVSFC